MVEVWTQTVECQGIWRLTKGLSSGSSEGTELPPYPGARLMFACLSPRTTPSPCTSSRAGGTNAWRITTFLSTWRWTTGWLTSYGCLTPISWMTRSPFCMGWQWRIAWLGSILMGLFCMAWGKSKWNLSLPLRMTSHLNFSYFQRYSDMPRTQKILKCCTVLRICSFSKLEMVVFFGPSKFLVLLQANAGDGNTVCSEYFRSLSFMLHNTSIWNTHFQLLVIFCKFGLWRQDFVTLVCI